MTLSDIDILASLARMGEKQAGILLCRYYHQHRNRTDYRYIFASKNLAFSLDSSVLCCMIDDFRTLDLSKSFRDGDTGFYPASYLAEQITTMLGNYPYPKKYEVDVRQFQLWLQETAQIMPEAK